MNKERGMGMGLYSAYIRRKAYSTVLKVQLLRSKVKGAWV